MRLSMRLSSILLVFFSLCLFGLSVLASDAPEKADSETLLKRAAEYWQFKIKGEFDKALAYEEPEIVKDMPVSDYVKSMGVGTKWLSAEPEKAEIKDNSGGVYLKVRYVWTFVDPGQQPEQGMEGFFWDHWTLVNGTWYHKFRSYDQKVKEINEITSKKRDEEGAKVTEGAAPAAEAQEKPKP